MSLWSVHMTENIAKCAHYFFSVYKRGSIPVFVLIVFHYFALKCEDEIASGVFRDFVTSMFWKIDESRLSGKKRTWLIRNRVIGFKTKGWSGQRTEHRW